MIQEPLAGQPRDFLEHSRLLEEVRGTRDDLELDPASHPSHCLTIELDDGHVVAADDEQSRSADGGKCVTGEIGAPSARHHSTHAIRASGRGDEGRATAGARTEQSNRQGRSFRLLAQPIDGADQSIGETWNVETEFTRELIDRVLFAREQIDEERRQRSVSKHIGHEAIASAEAAASTAVREEDDTNWLGRYGEGAVNHDA